jgi:uncharacterized RDD family membrane protein YckC
MSQSLSVRPNADPLTQGVLIRRFVAFVIDGIVMATTGWALAFMIVVFGILTFGFGFLMFHILPLLPFFYYTVLVGGTGATPGQRLLGVAVRQDESLMMPTYAQALVWSLLMWVSFVLAGLPFAMALVGARHRAGHDLLAGLVIIRHPQIIY